jgi:hypothetical protein
MEAFGNDLRQAHRKLLAGAADTVEMPAPVVTPQPVSPPAVAAPVFTPPPLPPQQPPSAASASSSAVQLSPAPSSTVFTPLPPPAMGVPSIADAISNRAARRGRDKRRVGKRRSRWKTIGIVLAVLWGFSWMRDWVSNGPRVPNERNGRSGTGDPSAIGDAVTDGVASGLQKLAPGSADLQLASAQLFWKNAQRSKAPADIRKAEDAFNEAIRLGLDDADDLAEARSALREIATMKKSLAVPPAP